MVQEHTILVDSRATMNFTIRTVLFVILSPWVVKGQPANGACETAQVISPTFESTPRFTANTDGGSVPDFPCGEGNDSPAVFYQFVGNGARIRISTCSNTTDFNTELILEVNGKTCGGSLPFCNAPSAIPDLDCDPLGKAVYLELYSVFNQLYLLAVQSRDIGSTGNFGLSFLEYKRPENDLCEDAALIQPRSDTVGTTVNATGGDFPCGRGNRSPAVFYQFVGNGARIRISTCSNVTNFNTDIIVEVTGTTCGGGLPFCNAPSATLDTTCDSTGQAVFIVIETKVDQIYLVAVQSRDTDGSGDFNLGLQSLGISSSPTTGFPTPVPITAATGFPAPAIGNPTPAPITATTRFPIQAPITAATGFPAPAVRFPTVSPITADSSNAPTGFPKEAIGFSTEAPISTDSSNASTGFPTAALVMIPIAIILVFFFGFFVYRRKARRGSQNEPSSSISKQQHNATLGAAVPEEMSHSATGYGAVPEDSAAPQSAVANPMERDGQVPSTPDEEGGAKSHPDGSHDLPQTKDQCRSVAIKVPQSEDQGRSVATEVPLASAIAVESMGQSDPDHYSHLLST